MFIPSVRTCNLRQHNSQILHRVHRGKPINLTSPGNKFLWSIENGGRGSMICGGAGDPGDFSTDPKAGAIS